MIDGLQLGWARAYTLRRPVPQIQIGSAGAYVVGTPIELATSVETGIPTIRGASVDFEGSITKPPSHVLGYGHILSKDFSQVSFPPTTERHVSCEWGMVGADLWESWQPLYDPGEHLGSGEMRYYGPPPVGKHAYLGWQPKTVNDSNSIERLVRGPVTLTFWAWLEAMYGDFSVWVDTVRTNWLQSPNNKWEFFSLDIPEGEHTLRMSITNNYAYADTALPLVTVNGLDWSANTFYDEIIDLGTQAQVGQYVSHFTNLIPEQRYYGRAYVLYPGGVAYGDVVSFTTAKGWSGNINGRTPQAIGLGHYRMDIAQINKVAVATKLI